MNFAMKIGWLLFTLPVMSMDLSELYFEESAYVQDNTVLVYHFGSHNYLEKILKNSALSSSAGVLYFNYVDSTLIVPHDQKKLWHIKKSALKHKELLAIAIAVDPTKTYVYNNYFRRMNLEEKYAKSKNLLADYIQQLEKNKQLCDELDATKEYVAILTDPYTAETSHTFSPLMAKKNSDNEYSNEIPIALPLSYNNFIENK